MGRTAFSKAWMLAASVSTTGTRFVDHGTVGAMVLAGSVGGGVSSSAISFSGGGVDSSATGGWVTEISSSEAEICMRRGVKWRSYEWAHNLFTSCLSFSLRSAKVRETGYTSEKVVAVVAAVACVRHCKL
jgi:hypothetical protein